LISLPTGRARPHIARAFLWSRRDGYPVERFQTTLAQGARLAEAFDDAAVAPFIREFTGNTLQTAVSAPLLAVMASFFYGREDVIPRMFSNLLEKWHISADQAPMFVYYLKRHIEVDSDEHGPAAKAILAAATANDPGRALDPSSTVPILK
jgi:hypothetical protein